MPQEHSTASKSFYASDTMLGAIKAEKTAFLAAPIGGAIALGTELLLSEIGATEPIRQVIENVVNGAIAGKDIQTIGIDSALLIGMGFLTKIAARKNTRAIVSGRINATQPINVNSVPKKYF